MDYQNFNAIFEFLGQFALRYIQYFSKKKNVDNFEIVHKLHSNFKLVCSTPLIVLEHTIHIS